MADLGDITASIRVDTSQLVQGVKRAQTNIGNFTKKTVTGFGNVARSVGRVNAALGGIALGLGVSLAIRKTVREFVKFENASLELQKVLDPLEGDVKQFTGTVDELSIKFGESAANILEGAATFKQAGFTAVEAFELQKTALDFVIAGNIEAAQASEILTAALKGFEAPASEAARFLDVVNEVSNKYATNAEELGIALSKLSPIAKLMNLNFEETAGIVTPIIEVFRSGSEAANAMKIALLSIIDDSKPTQDALKAIGVAQQEANGALRSGKDILFDVSKAFETLDENQKLFITSQLVGERQAGRVVKVFDGLAKSLEITAVAYNSAGSAQREVDIRLQSLGKKIDSTREGVNNLARSFGATLKEGITEALGSFDNLIAKSKKWVEANEADINKNITAFGEWVEDVVDGAGIIVEANNRIVESYRKDFNTIVKMNDAVVDAVVDTGKAIVKVNDAIVDAVVDTDKAIDGFVKSTVEKFTSIKEIDVAKKIVNTIKEFASLKEIDVTKEIVKQFQELPGKVDASMALVGKKIFDSIFGIKEAIAADPIEIELRVKRKAPSLIKFLEDQPKQPAPSFITSGAESTQNPFALFEQQGLDAAQKLSSAFKTFDILPAAEIEANAQKFIDAFHLIDASGTETKERLREIGSALVDSFKGGEGLSDNIKTQFDIIKKASKNTEEVLNKFQQRRVTLNLITKDEVIASFMEEVEAFKQAAQGKEKILEQINEFEIEGLKRIEEEHKKSNEAKLQAEERFAQLIRDSGRETMQDRIDAINKEFESLKKELDLSGPRLELFNDLWKGQLDEVANGYNKITSSANKAANAAKKTLKIGDPVAPLTGTAQDVAIPKVGDPGVPTQVFPVPEFARGGILNTFAKGGTLITKPTIFDTAQSGKVLAGEAGTEAIFPLKKIGGELGIKAVIGGDGGSLKDLFRQSQEQINAFRDSVRKQESLTQNIFREMQERSRREDPLRQAIGQEFSREFSTTGTGGNDNIDIRFNVINESGVDIDAEAGNITKDKGRIVGDLIIRSARTSRRVRDALRL